MLLQQRQNYKKPQNGFLQCLRGGKVYMSLPDFTTSTWFFNEFAGSFPLGIYSSIF
jgi:hypothetical protein